MPLYRHKKTGEHRRVVKDGHADEQLAASPNWDVVPEPTKPSPAGDARSGRGTASIDLTGGDK